MNVSQGIIAQKYATAFYNVYGDDISLDSFWVLRSAGSYLKYIPGVLFFLTLVDIDPKVREQMIEVLLKKLKLPSSFTQLILLLMKHRRVFLLPLVLQFLMELCQEKHNALLFTISTPKHLEDDADKQEIERFLHRLSGCHILAEYTCDTNLIAGTRALNKNYLWEYSIENKMWSITNSLV
ncbi:MAG TPA: F0F1 ATP synthase subunit delta [Candidatus Babeliales bacterium]|nr:F0F1 ATP synthase subunit delta [Candidatus Babeliales bacterium]